MMLNNIINSRAEPEKKLNASDLGESSVRPAMGQHLEKPPNYARRAYDYLNETVLNGFQVNSIQDFAMALRAKTVVKRKRSVKAAHKHSHQVNKLLLTS